MLVFSKTITRQEMANLRLFFIPIILFSFVSSSFILAQRKIQLGRNEIQKSKHLTQPKKKKVKIELKRERLNGRKKVKKNDCAKEKRPYLQKSIAKKNF